MRNHPDPNEAETYMILSEPSGSRDRTRSKINSMYAALHNFSIRVCAVGDELTIGFMREPEPDERIQRE